MEPEHVLLDLERCAPHEYEGKVVLVNGAAYRIGSFLAQGGDKIVHELTNVVSGLTLHVIKVFRNQGQISEHAASLMRQFTEMQRYFRDSLVDMLLDQSHGGWFEMQDALPFLLPGKTSSPPDVAFATAASAEKNGCWEEAIGHYEHALRLNPHHSHALVGVARVQAELGRRVEAFLAHEQALLIEPNRCGYYLSLADLAYQFGLPFKTIDTYEAMKRRFPYQEGIDELVAAALVSCGEPERALELLETSGRRDLDEQTTAVVRERATELLEARHRAAPAWQRAGAAVVAGDVVTAYDALTQALALDPQDPWLEANHALLEAQTGNPHADTRLTAVFGFLPSHLHQVCQVSLAFHTQLAAPDSTRARELIREIGAQLPSAEETLRQMIPTPALIWLDLDGLRCIDPAHVLVPAAARAFETTGDLTFRAVATLYSNPQFNRHAFDAST